MNYLDRIGETNINNQGLKMEIIEYKNNNNIDILFENKYIAKNKKYYHFKDGGINNPYYKNICNIGFIGEGIYKTGYKNMNIQYVAWYNMIKRCYDKNLHEKIPTYKDCSVCEEWHNYQVFAKWFDENYYKVDNEKTQLDKDILFKGNKIYSPKTCVFVPERINMLFTKRQNDRGKYPIGVSYDKGMYKFKSQININQEKQKILGYYDTSNEAFNIYKQAKEKYIKEIAEEYKDKIPQKLYNAMYNYIVEITD